MIELVNAYYEFIPSRSWAQCAVACATPSSSLVYHLLGRAKPCWTRGNAIEYNCNTVTFFISNSSLNSFHLYLSFNLYSHPVFCSQCINGFSILEQSKACFERIETDYGTYENRNTTDSECAESCRKSEGFQTGKCESRVCTCANKNHGSETITYLRLDYDHWTCEFK